MNVQRCRIVCTPHANLPHPSDRRRRLHLDDTNTNRQEKQGQPFRRRERLSKEDDRERRSSQNLHLICNLKRRHGKITDSYELQRVLHDVKNSWYEQLSTIGAKNLTAYLAERRRPRKERLHEADE
jgi:hypothetical protein